MSRGLRGAVILAAVLTAACAGALAQHHGAVGGAHSAAAHKSHGTEASHHAAAHTSAHTKVATRATGRHAGKGESSGKHAAAGHARGRRVAARGRRRRGAREMVARAPMERFTASPYAENAAQGDVIAGEDPVVRAAALQALGNMNGTALAIDPSSGRILAMVNQRLALSSGAEPCSTIKVAVALAGLSEGLIKADTPVNLGGHYSLDLTHALAKSVNLYFEVLGRAMGFERVKHYANEFGLGELAGYNIAGEQLGVYPDQELPIEQGGVGRMCSFGESISMTPLQLGALVSAVANGGTLYYLQHPTTPEEVAAFEPKVKRLLDIKNVIPELLPGMQGAVDFSNGTARSLRANFIQFPVFGKTGTCSNNGTRFGWFVSYGDAPTGRIVTVIFLEGNRQVAGPRAAELTGEFYRAMYERSYFQSKPAAIQPAPSTTDGGAATTVASPAATSGAGVQ